MKKLTLLAVMLSLALAENSTDSILTVGDAGHAERSTEFSHFKAAFATSCSLTLVNEIGDRSFFVTALLALKFPRLCVFVGALMAMLAQTVVGVSAGRILHSVPSAFRRYSKIPVDDYAASLLLCLFSLWHLRAAWISEDQPNDQDNPNSVNESVRELGAPMMDETVVSRRDAAWPQIRESFWVVFLAEFGDKSMFSTAALATAQSAMGVLLGASMAHCFVTGAAVVGGAALHFYLSEKSANYIGAILFLIFGLLTGMEGLARQGLVAAEYSLSTKWANWQQ
eukprot:GHVO01032852.1.p1 GENE.GHVO01032852.1~~GHVO01032852.1.p1  ORF type:complete len:291 (-),score=21.23 GHVO01032852.1:432-1277(-)